ncbi:MAG: hypothetical protein JWO79_2185, partial [Actinomycetia bacterium]|nr:hypothetical protein [Actinomycetes bacterium]
LHTTCPREWRTGDTRRDYHWLPAIGAPDLETGE